MSQREEASPLPQEGDLLNRVAPGSIHADEIKATNVANFQIIEKQDIHIHREDSQ